MAKRSIIDVWEGFKHVSGLTSELISPYTFFLSIKELNK